MNEPNNPTVLSDRPAPPREPPRFSPGDVLAGRWRIVRLLAHGGMGEVYEAEDPELTERVALKTVRPRLAADEKALERFRREIQLARKVTHPGICRLHDLGRHVAADGAEVVFLTMELLEGEALDERIARAPLTTSEALPIVRQLASALDAAHAAGVIHRDFKSSNVLLVPGSAGPRAVVTDFGLATTGLAEERSLTLTGLVVGTPAYMAPEQLEDGDVTPAADQYALGVVVFEMLTGDLPFHGRTDFSAAVKRLTQEPMSPRRLRPELPSRWEEAILRSLSRAPADRFASAGDFARALAGEEVARGRGRHWRRRRMLTAGSLVLVATSAGALLWLRQERSVSPRAVEPAPGSTSRPAPPARRPRPSVAVLGFRNATGQDATAWISAALSEMLSTELSAGGRLRLVPGETVERMRRELGVREAETFAPDTLKRIQRHVGADYVVLGSFVVLPSGKERSLRLDLRLQEASTGELVASVPLSGREEDLLQLVADAGIELRRRLGIAGLSTAESASLAAARPRRLEAARLYAEGLRALSRSEARAARELLERAVTVEPEFAPAQAALAQALAELGYDAKAEVAARRAYQASSSLPEADRLLVEARFRRFTNDLPGAIEVLQKLVLLQPDDLDRGLQLAQAQTQASRGRDALGTVAALRRLPPPAGEDPQVDLAEASAHRSLSDFGRQLELAERAARKGSAMGASLLVARAKLHEAWALRNMGEPARSRAVAGEARRSFEAAGDLGGVGQALMYEAIAFENEGDQKASRSRYEEALRRFRSIGSVGGTSRALGGLASLLTSVGELERARAMHEEALALRREVGDGRGTAISLNNLAEALLQLGDLPGARARYDESLRIKRQIGDRAGEAVTLNNLAGLLSSQGELAEARRLVERSIQIKRTLTGKGAIASSLHTYGQILFTVDEPGAARAALEEAIGLRTEAGVLPDAHASRIVLATVLADQGKLAEAERLAREALEGLKGRGGEEGAARCVLARVLIRAGRAGEAVPLLPERLSATAPRGRSAPPLELARAVGLAVPSRVQEAERRLVELRRLAEKNGDVSTALASRLALAELAAASASGAGPAARDALSRLPELAAESETRGFRMLARHAREIAARRIGSE